MEAGGAALHLDAGNFAAVTPGTEPVRTPFVWNALADLEVAATTIGPAELAQWSRIDSLRSVRPIPIVASNLLRTATEVRATPATERNQGRESGPHTAAPHRWLILERGDIRIGVIALLDPALLGSLPADERERWRALDPRTALDEILPSLRGRTDLIVLLSQMPTGMTDAVLAATEGIDVAFYGLRPPREESAVRIRSTIGVRSGSKGQYLGRLDLELTGPHELGAFRVDTRALDKEFPADIEWSGRVVRGVEEADSARAAYQRREQEAFEARFR